MPEYRGYKTIDIIARELGITEDQVRAFIAVLDIQSRTFPDDRRRRYYSPEDVARIKQIVDSRQS